MKSFPRLFPLLFRFVLLFLWVVLPGCDRINPGPNPVTGRSDQFEPVAQRVTLEPGKVDEASGLADSRTLDGYLWTHEDAGNLSLLYLISREGKVVQQYEPAGIINRDWEDIAVGPGPKQGVSYLYLGDIGNNDANASTDVLFIYRMPEPTSLDGTFRAADIDRISYRYPDGPRDAEALLVDPQTKDLFIISKELDRANLYRLPYPQSVSEVLTAEKIGSIPSVQIATGGDIAFDGQEILVRTYTNIFYWKRGPNETVGQVLSRSPNKTVPYELEPQGEAVCFDREAKGYFTLSERRSAANVTLNYFRRR
jgi:hypothetical protein